MQTSILTPKGGKIEISYYGLILSKEFTTWDRLKRTKQFFWQVVWEICFIKVSKFQPPLFHYKPSADAFLLRNLDFKSRVSLTSCSVVFILNECFFLNNSICIRSSCDFFSSCCNFKNNCLFLFFSRLSA